MCAVYTLKTPLPEILSHFRAEASSDIIEFAVKNPIVPQSLAPVVYLESDQRVVRPMRFSLLPSWSKESKVKFATYNARLETVDTKATWKKPFKSQHCLVPMSGFMEAIYSGEHAGHMVEFLPKKDPLCVVAGIYDVWIDPETKQKLYSFALLTHEPHDFIRTMGHDREPIFIQSPSFESWLRNDVRTPESLKEFLLENRAELEFTVRNERALKPGWEKRKDLTPTA